MSQYPETEVTPTKGRRRFTAAEKRRLVEAADACSHGELGPFLRREGLYYGQIIKWREERDAGTLADRKRGPKADPHRAELRRLEAENAKLQRKLAQAEAIIEAQKKLARLLESLDEAEAVK